MARDRIEHDRAQVVLAGEPDRMPGVPRADVDEELARPRLERSEPLEEPLLAARLEAPLQLRLQFRIAGPELVELLDRGHRLPPAIAGRRMTVEASSTGVSSPSRVRTSSPST